jgi:hypothetical protein
MLMQSLLDPRAGDPSEPVQFFARESEISFLHTKSGQKMSAVREVLQRDLMTACSPKSNLDQSKLSSYFINVERVCDTGYGYGQISMHHLTRKDPVVRAPTSKPAVPIRDHDTSFLQDYLREVREVYSGLLQTASTQSTLVLYAMVKSIVMLSDIFSSEQQHSWTLASLLNVRGLFFYF